MTTFEIIREIVAKIPKGKVATYKQIAQVSDVANARTVGFAMRANKNTNKVPCHRVVGSNGKLRGYAYGGIRMKKVMLENEGVKFLDNETVDLQTSQVKSL